MALAEMALLWRPGVSFLGYFQRRFAAAIAQYLSRAEATETIGLLDDSGDALTLTLSRPTVGKSGHTHGPFSAADMASLPEVERQIVFLRAFEARDMQGSP